MEADPPGDLVDALGSAALFAGLGRKDLLTVVKLGRELSFLPGEKIVEAGEGDIAFYLILEGKVQMRREGRLLSELGTGDLFGARDLLGDGFILDVVHMVLKHSHDDIPPGFIVASG